MKLFEAISFREKSFRETRLGADPAPETRFALSSLLSRRAFFVTGAGSSAGAPTGLPTGPQLAGQLVAWARDSGFGTEMDALVDPTDLGDVCESLKERPGRVQLLQEIEQSVPWKTSEPNLCHMAIALLYAEEVVSVSFTANWDPKLSDAFERVANRHEPRVARNATTMGMVGNNPYLVHLHGMWSDPDSLVMTNAELAEPHVVKWTDPNLRSALTSQDPIFVGFAAEPKYVLRSLQDMHQVMERPPASVIGRDDVQAFSAASPELSRAMRLNEDQGRYVQGEACEVLGELLRGFYRKRIEEVIEAALLKVNAADGLRASFNTLGRERLKGAIGELSLEDLLSLLWSSTARASQDAACKQRTVADGIAGLEEILACVMVLAGIEGVSGLSASPFGFRLDTQLSGPVELWPVLPEGPLSPSDARTYASRHSDRFAGPAGAEVPMVLVCGGTVGAIPKGGKVSLVGTGSPAKVRSGRRSPKDTIDLTLLDERLAELDGTPRIAEALRL